jgi:peptide/nickel transport system permease protein
MTKYIFRRLFYSIFVFLGVLLITFLLFKVAAGDPASMLLGKNPSPLEIEELRLRLASNKPLFYGRWQKTEMYSSADFSLDRQYPSVIIPKNAVIEKNVARLLPASELVFIKNFEATDNVEILVKIVFDGSLEFDGKILRSEDRTKLNSIIKNSPREIRLKSIDGANISSLTFYRENTNPLDSQMLNSLKEIISFTSDFPFIKVFSFGTALITKENINEAIWRSIWPSMGLMVPVFLLELFISIPLAMFAAVMAGKLSDKIITLLSVIGMSVSYVVLIVIGQWFFAYYLGIFPVWGFENASYLILPVMLGVINGLGGNIRFYRTIFLNELNKEYLRTAIAKGCSPINIYMKHLLRNSAIPIIARVSSVLPFLFTGSLLLESFFGIPGLGFASINALMNSDIQMLKAVVFLTSVIFVFFNLSADIMNIWADPRVRIQ